MTRVSAGVDEKEEQNEFLRSLRVGSSHPFFEPTGRPKLFVPPVIEQTTSFHAQNKLWTKSEKETLIKFLFRKFKILFGLKTIRA